MSSWGEGVGRKEMKFYLIYEFFFIHSESEEGEAED